MKKKPVFLVQPVYFRIYKASTAYSSSAEIFLGYYFTLGWIKTRNLMTKLSQLVMDYTN